MADAAARLSLEPLVVDPVLVATSGDALARDDAAAALRDLLLPRAALVTPNWQEAGRLTGAELATERDAEAAARALRACGAAAVLVTGGDRGGDEVADYFDDGLERRWLRAPRVDTRHSHGTGCTLSAAIAARLAAGAPLHDAIATARRYVARALATAPGLGTGRGPLNHGARE